MFKAPGSTARVFRTFLVVLLSVMMSHAPEALAIDLHTEGMISTMDTVEMLGRSEMEAKARAFLNRADLQEEFKKFGVDPQEAAQRLATLSQDELRQLVSQMDQARLGGDVGGILIVVVLVLLIIFLAKRI